MGGGGGGGCVKKGGEIIFFGGFSYHMIPGIKKGKISNY